MVVSKRHLSGVLSDVLSSNTSLERTRGRQSAKLKRRRARGSAQPLDRMPSFRRYLTVIGVMLAAALALRLFLNIPSWLTFAGLVIAWPLVGTLITIDDDLPGGW